MNNLKSRPLVSIIIPCRNEENYISKCLMSIISADYPKDKLEVLVVDGTSNDGTRGIVEEYVERYSYIRLLDNPMQITPCALNIGIENSQGDLILWMSAHNEYEKEYVSKCIKYLEEFNADAVGGIIRTLPRNDNIIEKLICIATSHPFGVGNSIHKIGSRNAKWVDTAFGICYKREIFKIAGTFNENLVRGQDMEFSLRLKRAGLRTLLVPEIVSYYYPRSDFKSFLKHTFKNGAWAILPFKFTTTLPVSFRHLVPFAFVSSLILSAGLSFFLPILLWFFLLILSIYFLINMYFSSKLAIDKNDLTYLFIMPIIFSTLHLSYGLGSVLGLVAVLLSKRFWANLFIILRKKLKLVKI